MITTVAFIYQKIHPYQIDCDAICELQLLRRIDILPRASQTSIIVALDNKDFSFDLSLSFINYYCMQISSNSFPNHQY